MTPAAYISLARDIIVLALVGFLVYLLISFGENRVDKKDLKALEQRIIDNGNIVKGWRDQAVTADAQHQKDMQQISAAVAAHTSPIRLCNTSRSGTMSSSSGSAPSVAPASGPANAGARGDSIDLRPVISGFEEKYESTLADCRRILSSWPRSP